MTPEECQIVVGRDIKEIKITLKALDEAIRGNGKEGFVVRIDRLEKTAQRRNRMEWIFLSSFLVLAAGKAWSYFGV